MTNQELSKMKYVYRIYCNYNKEVHLEKYPVIYANQDFVYYKQNGNSRLSCIHRRFMHTDYPEYITKYLDCIFWVPAEEITHIYNRCKLEIDKQVENSNIDSLRKRCEQAKEEYEKAKAAYEAYQEYIAEKEEVKNHE